MFTENLPIERLPIELVIALKAETQRLTTPLRGAIRAAIRTAKNDGIADYLIGETVLDLLSQELQVTNADLTDILEDL